MKNKFARHSVNKKVCFALIACMVFVTIEGCGTSVKASKNPKTTSTPKKVPVDPKHRSATSVDPVKMNK
ncbi:MAG: hypothetical protein ABI288_08605 [Ginsengibacter sp.]